MIKVWKVKNYLTKSEKLSSMEKKEKRHVKRKSKVKGLSYEIINEDTEDVKLPEKKRQKKEKKTSFEVTDEEKPGYPINWREGIMWREVQNLASLFWIWRLQAWFVEE